MSLGVIYHRYLPWRLRQPGPGVTRLVGHIKFKQALVAGVDFHTTKVRYGSSKVGDATVSLVPDDLHATNLHGNRLLADEIRLFYLLPNKTPAARVEGLLTRGNLDSKLHYTALSYTCGNPFPPSASGNSEESLIRNLTYDQTRKDQNIIVNGVKLPVSRNIFEALTQLRNVTRTPGLWVDAICINQGDETEIGQQVRNMGRIFHDAQEVLVWLGKSENDHNLDMALRLIDEIFFAFKKWYDKHRPTKFDKWWEDISKDVLLTPDSEDQIRFWERLKEDGYEWVRKVHLQKHLSRTDRRAWQALDQLLSRSWFDRVWTWQEKELARTIRVFVGQKKLSWRRLRLAMLLVMAHDQAQARSEYDQLMPGRQYLHVVDNLNIDRKPTLLDILINVRHRDCFDKLDKIFGVLGAAAQRETTSQDAARFLKLVDYNKNITTPAKIYTEFARYYIQEKGDLRVLQACNPRTSGAPSELPSWAADWSDITHSHQLSSHIYDAARGTKVKAEYDFIDKSMTLSGIVIDRIGIACHDAQIDDLERRVDESVDWDHWRDAIIETYVKVYVHGTYRGSQKHMAYVGFPFHSCWAQLVDVLRACDRYEATAEPVSEAFWRCLMVDKMPGTKMDEKQRIDSRLNVCQRFHGEALRRTVDPGLRREVERDFVHTQKAVSVQSSSELESDHHDGDDHYLPGWFEAMQRTVLHKRFFRTEKLGLFGMAPSNLQPGDLVCVLDGGTVPFLLRETGDGVSFNFVEEAYVHGYMDGQAVDKANKNNHDDIDSASTRRRQFRIR